MHQHCHKPIGQRPAVHNHKQCSASSSLKAERISQWFSLYYTGSSSVHNNPCAVSGVFLSLLHCHKPLFWSLTNHYIIINNICVSLTTLVLIDVYICANLAYNFSLPACRLEHMCVSVCGYIHREHGNLCEFHLANCTIGFFLAKLRQLKQLPEHFYCIRVDK